MTISPLVPAEYELGEAEPVVRGPDAGVNVVYRVPAEGPADLLVIGPWTRASYHWKQDPPFCVGVRIRPGSARPLLGVALPELVDRIVRLESLWGAPAAALRNDLAADGRDAARLRARLIGALESRLALTRPAELARAEILQEAAGRLAATEPVGTVAHRLGVSERHLRNLFVDGIGLPPKQFARIDRVRTVAALAGRSRLAELAAETGFYDQSHMTAEFRSLMGVPPAAFAEGRLPVAEGCSSIRG